MDDVLLNKAATIERCLKRIHEEYDGHESAFATDFTRQDSIILNLQRACEAAIDMATHVVRLKHLGLSQSSRDVFVLLEQAEIIPSDLSHHLQAMVGFRNIAVHDYKTLNLEIIQHLIEHRLSDFTNFTRNLLSLAL
jgi:uncharacterized protein YutE (UPF0331/DUF86 family)